MAVTNDLDVSMATYLQFEFVYGCGSRGEWLKSHLVVLQFSTNGGVDWTTLVEIHYSPHKGPK